MCETDHLMTDHWLCAEARAAPSKPPIKAWLELDGRPKYQVSRFHPIPPSIPQKTVAVVMKWASTNPAPIVLATATPDNAPMKLVTAPITTACRGVNTRVPTTVAMALAAS